VFTARRFIPAGWFAPAIPPPKASVPSPHGPVRAITFSPDGRLLAATSNDGTIRLWDVSQPRTPHPLATFTQRIAGEVAAAAFSPDGHTLATAGQRLVVLWDITDPAAPRARAELGGYPDTTGSVSFSPDGRTLATIGVGTSLTRLWDVTDPDQPHELPFRFGTTDIAPAGTFSPDGRVMATVADSAGPNKTVRLLDFTDRLHPRLLATLTSGTEDVYSVAFSPDSRQIAIAGADKSVRLWDIADLARPQLIATFSGHTGIVPAVVFAPDGHTLATGSRDHTALLWETRIDTVIARVCALAEPVITKAEWARYFPGRAYQPPCSR